VKSLKTYAYQLEAPSLAGQRPLRNIQTTRFCQKFAFAISWRRGKNADTRKHESRKHELSVMQRSA